MTHPKYSQINLPSIFQRRLRKLVVSCSVVSDSSLQHLQQNRVLSKVYDCELSSFDNVSIETVSELIALAPSKTCALDPIPTHLLKQCTELLVPTVTKYMINFSLSTGTVPNEWKDAIVLPTLKRKQDVLTKENNPPISNLKFVSKICDKTVAVQFTNHLRKNSLMKPFQSAYSIDRTIAWKQCSCEYSMIF